MSRKGLIFNINKYAVNDGPGIRTSVFLKGCPLNCRWCHNPESRDSTIEKPASENLKKILNLPLSETKNVIGRIVSVEELTSEILKDRVFYEESGGGATFSGGEPMMQPEFLLNMLKSCRKNGIHTAVDTSGYASTDSFQTIAEFADLFLFDLKLADNKEHIKYTGVPNALILKNLSVLNDLGKEIRIRIPLIPGITDTPGNISGIMKIIEKLNNIEGVDILPFNELINGKYTRLEKELELRELKTQSEEELNAISGEFEARGYAVTTRG